MKYLCYYTVGQNALHYQAVTRHYIIRPLLLLVINYFIGLLYYNDYVIS